MQHIKCKTCHKPISKTQSKSHMGLCGYCYISNYRKEIKDYSVFKSFIKYFKGKMDLNKYKEKIKGEKEI